MDWKDTLREILAREAMGYFKDRYAEQEEFFQHMSALTGVHDWSEDFLKCCYDTYLEKINQFGNQLSANQHS
jgi:hypothetical protein